jgi:hypothetical protein
MVNASTPPPRPTPTSKPTTLNGFGAAANKTFDRSENGWLRAKQLVCSCLEAACACHRIEATKLMKRHFVHYRNNILSDL